MTYALLVFVLTLFVIVTISLIVRVRAISEDPVARWVAFLVVWSCASSGIALPILSQRTRGSPSSR